MMDRHLEKINTIINEGYEFKFGDYLSQGFDMLQKHLGNFILFALIYFLISGVVGAIPFGIGSVLSNLLITPLATAGFYIAIRRADKGEHFELNHFFQGVEKVGPLVLVSFIVAAITLVATIPFFLVIDWQGLFNWYMEIVDNPEIFQEDPEYIYEIPSIPPWAYLLLLPSLYFSIAYTFAIPFVVFYNFDFWTAMESSRKLVTKKWFIFFLFVILLGLFVVIGIMLCCVGLLAALPLVHICTYYAFADVTRLNDEPEEGSGIEQHLVG